MIADMIGVKDVHECIWSCIRHGRSDRDKFISCALTIVDREAHDGHADTKSEYSRMNLKERTCPCS